MILTTIDLEKATELMFEYKQKGTTQAPTEYRFIIEGTDDFSIICRAVRDNDSIKVYIPRLLNLFKSGTYKSKMEIVLEDRLFVPLREDIELVKPEIGIGLEMKEQIVSEKETPVISLKSLNFNSEFLDGVVDKLLVHEDVTTQSALANDGKEEIVPASAKSLKINSLKNPFRRKKPDQEV